MNKILITMKFWTDGQENSTRIRNVNYTWSKLKKLKDFFSQNNINCESRLYDFSPEKILDESIHIPFELGSYMKSAKTNKIINSNTDCDYMFMFDCDAFFVEDDFCSLLDIINSLESGDFVTFDLAKLDEMDTISIIKNDFVDKSMNWSYAYSGNKSNGPLCCGHVGGLGGVYICDLNLLRDLGGFNEKYVGWGGEDGEMIERIVNSRKKHKQIPIRNVTPFHLSHFYDWSSEKYNKRFLNE